MESLKSVTARRMTWKTPDGKFFVKFYDSYCGIFGQAVHEDREMAETIAKANFLFEYKGLIQESVFAVEVTVGRASKKEEEAKDLEFLTKFVKKENCLQCSKLPEGEQTEGHDHQESAPL